MKLYKILIKKEGGKYYSPFQNYCYGFLEDFLNIPLTNDYFDESNQECSNGFYATELQGLIYTNMARSGSTVFEVEMSGNSKKFSDYKWRWEKQTFLKELSLEEIKNLVKMQSEKMDWNYYDMLFPKNPLEKLVNVKEKHILLLKKWDSVRNSVGDSVGASIRNSVWDSMWTSVWDSVRDSVWDSIRNSVWASIRNSVWDSIRDSVWDSIRDSVGTYISSGFPNIKKWKYIDHEEGVNPFQPCIDLWNDNIVPSFDGNIWRLHSGPKAEIIFEISKKDLQNY